MALFLTTFRNLLKFRSTVIYMIIMCLVPTILSFILKSQIYSGNFSFASQINYTIDIYYILVFMWVLGIPFLIMISAKGIGLIANELTEGTLGLLVTMKISRSKIVISKWFALYIATLLLGLLSILLNISIFSLVSGMDSNILEELIKSIPYLFQYLVVISFIYSTLSILISLIMKSKILATISMTFYVIIIFLIIPLFKSFLNSFYDKYHLYYIDINYQFSLVYYYFINQNHVVITPLLQSVMGRFMGIFDITKINDADMSILLHTPLMKTAPIYSYFNALHVLLFWVMIGSCSVIASMILLSKRDIN